MSVCESVCFYVCVCVRVSVSHWYPWRRSLRDVRQKSQQQMVLLQWFQLQGATCSLICYLLFRYVTVLVGHVTGLACLSVCPVWALNSGNKKSIEKPKLVWTFQCELCNRYIISICQHQYYLFYDLLRPAPIFHRSVCSVIPPIISLRSCVTVETSRVCL